MIQTKGLLFCMIVVLTSLSTPTHTHTPPHTHKHPHTHSPLHTHTHNTYSSTNTPTHTRNDISMLTLAASKVNPIKNFHIDAKWSRQLTVSLYCEMKRIENNFPFLYLELNQIEILIFRFSRDNC